MTLELNSVFCFFKKKAYLHACIYPWNLLISFLSTPNSQCRECPTLSFTLTCMLRKVKVENRIILVQVSRVLRDFGLLFWCFVSWYGNSLGGWFVQAYMGIWKRQSWDSQLRSSVQFSFLVTSSSSCRKITPEFSVTVISKIHQQPTMPSYSTVNLYLTYLEVAQSI